MTLPFTGEPSHGAKMWSKEALINSLANMENANQKTGAFVVKRQERGAFINEILEKGKAVYNDSSSCTVMIIIVNLAGTYYTYSLIYQSLCGR